MPTEITRAPSDRSKWTVQILADFLDERQRNNESLIRSRYEGDQTALRAAMNALDQRLEAMNNFRSAMGDQAARMLPRAEFEAQINAQRERFEESLQPINKALADQGKTNPSLMVGVVSVALTVLAGCWLLIGLEINVATAPQVLATEGIKTQVAVTSQTMNLLEQRIRAVESSATASSQADAESRADRSKLNASQSLLQAQLAQGTADRRATQARIESTITEIETQFCGNDIVRNLIHANDLRYLSMLWATTHKGEVLPISNAYYPTICNRASVAMQERDAR